jgi:CubicO group peptidase (beta-lactamase class C family)
MTDFNRGIRFRRCGSARGVMGVAVTLFVFGVAGELRAQASVAAVADSVFAEWNSTHTPGCAVGVARHGKVLFQRGYGMANLETGTPITPETILESGSVAKQFTATAVLLLARDGRLRLDDDVRKYLPEMPRYDRTITIRHLLTHTSGLREWSSLVAAAGWSRGNRSHTQLDLLDVAYRQKSLNYPVGEHYSYTNTGYAIAMSLVERVSGKTFQEFSRERIFEPLGMRNSSWRDDHTRVVPGRAQAYARRDGEWRLAMPFESVVGPGGLLTTVGDWLRWNEALASGALFPGHADSLARRMKLNSGREIRYGLGLFVSQHRGVRELYHSGSTGGYRTYLTRFPDHGNLSIAVLCNAASAQAGRYAHSIADALIEDFPAPPRLDTTRVDSASFARYAGVYRNDVTRTPLEVASDAHRSFRALPGGWYWLGNDSRWRFEPGRLTIVEADGDTARHTRVSDRYWAPTIEQLRQFEGSYASDELGVTYQVWVEDGSLMMSVRPGVAFTLRPRYADAFARGGTTVWFTRDSRGSVTAMHLGESRMWDLTLRRSTAR